MRFGLVRQRAGEAPRARRGIDRQQPGLSRVDREQCRGRGARLSQHLCRRAPFHRLRPGLGEPQPADLARRPHHDAAARHRGAGAAVAQPGAARRAGRDARPAVRRPARFRRRQGLSLQRVRRLLRRRWRRPTRASTRRWRSSPRPSPATRRSATRQYWQYDNIVVEPPTAQRPHPPFWMGAGSERSVRQVAERGYNLLLGQYDLAEECIRHVAQFKADVEARGRSYDPMEVGVARAVHFAKDARTIWTPRWNAVTRAICASTSVAPARRRRRASASSARRGRDAPCVRRDRDVRHARPDRPQARSSARRRGRIHASSISAARAKTSAALPANHAGLRRYADEECAVKGWTGGGRRGERARDAAPSDGLGGPATKGNAMLTDAQRPAYDRDGFIVVPDVFTPEEIAGLRRVPTNSSPARRGSRPTTRSMTSRTRTRRRSRACAGSRRRSDPSGLCPRQPQRKDRRHPEGFVGHGAVRHRQAQHEVGRLWRAGRMAPGLGLLSAHQ